MTKKKKGRSSKSTIVIHTSDTTAPTTSHDKNDHSKDRNQTSSASFLELRVLKSSSNKSTGAPQRRAIPTLILTVEDAVALGVITEDYVFVLSKEGPPSLAVCVIRIAKTKSSSSTPRGAPPTPTTNNTTENRIPRGSCQMEPFTLLNNNLDDSVSNHIQNPSPPTNNGTDQIIESSIESNPKEEEDPTTPSKGFSFTNFPSPSTKHTTPQRTPSRNSSRIALVIRVVPFHSELGKTLLVMVGHNNMASHVTLSSPTVKQGLARFGEIISRLFMAYCEGRFVKHGEVIQISFRGQPLAVSVDSVQGTNRHDNETTTTTTTDLDDRLAQLSLSDGNDQRNTPTIPADHQSILEPILQAMQDETTAMTMRLYQITLSTKIAFHEPNDAATPLPSTATTEPTHWVAGLSSVEEQIRSMLLIPLLRPETYLQRGLPAPRGILLHGPSGVGKSLLARQFALEMSSQHSIRVQHVNCASLQSHTNVVGEAEQRLMDLFRSAERRSNETTATQKSSTLLVLDDIHLICPRRSGKHVGVDRLASTLLALMDGLSSTTSSKRIRTNHVVILAVTSNPSLLDPAIRRAGRLDSEVEVPIPDEADRAEILKFQLDHLGPSVALPALSDTEVMALSRLAKGFNGADCMLALKEALRAALLRNAMKPAGTAVSNAVIPLTLDDMKTAIRAAKPSTINSITVEIPQVPWSSIGGMDSVKEQLKEAIEFPITHAHLFRELRIPPPRGVLLYGPPGCSKTLMARALATEGHMNFLAVKGPELLSKWLGESERALASLFRRARMASPCIIFFDEIDAIASKRGYGDGGSTSDRLLSQLLTELDGVGNSNGILPTRNGREQRVVVVGATNRPDLLDSALTRPGRIDKMIYVGVPDEKSRAKIFEIGLRGRALADDIDVSCALRPVCFDWRCSSSRLIHSRRFKCCRVSLSVEGFPEQKLLQFAAMPLYWRWRRKTRHR